MNCELYEELMSAFIDGEVDAHESTELFAHLSACSGCQDCFRNLLHLREAVRSLPLEELRPEFHQRVLSHPLVEERRRTKIPVQMSFVQGLLVRKLSISVASAAITVIMIALWSMMFSSMILRKESAIPSPAPSTYLELRGE